MGLTYIHMHTDTRVRCLLSYVSVKCISITSAFVIPVVNILHLNSLPTSLLLFVSKTLNVFESIITIIVLYLRASAFRIANRFTNYVSASPTCF